MLTGKSGCEPTLSFYFRICTKYMEPMADYVGTGKEIMARREEYEAKAEAMITPIIEANHFELVDVEYVKEGSSWYLRAYIDKEAESRWMTVSL